VKALPPKPPTYGPGPVMIKLIRFQMYMKTLEEANERFFRQSRDEQYEGLSPLQKESADAECLVCGGPDERK
jgi:hypothetical protein